MRTAALVFFYGCLCAGAWWAFAAWARRSVARHVDEGLKPNGNWVIVSDQFDRPGTAWSHESGEWGTCDPQVARGLELAGDARGVIAEAERITREAAK